MGAIVVDYTRLVIYMLCGLQVLPKVLHQLNQVKDSMEDKNRELKIYDNAIAEIELNYGHILFTPEFYAPTIEQQENTNA
jgi:hypothetical protein